MEFVCGNEVAHENVPEYSKDFRMWCRRPAQHAGPCLGEPLEDDPPTVQYFLGPRAPIEAEFNGR